MICKEEGILLQQLGSNIFFHTWHSFLGAFSSHVTEPVYYLLRILFRRRMDDVARKDDRLPREFNFLHIAEQAMEVDFAENSGKGVAVFLFMAIFLFVSMEVAELKDIDRCWTL